MFVKPVEGKLVRHPMNRSHLPTEGIEVSESAAPHVITYFVRRKREGVVEIFAQKPEGAAPVEPLTYES